MELKIEDDTRGDENGGILIKVTHNGYQWSSLRVYSPEEIEQIRDFLTNYLFAKKYYESE
jgi:hypothetical protein